MSRYVAFACDVPERPVVPIRAFGAAVRWAVPVAKICDRAVARLERLSDRSDLVLVIGAHSRRRSNGSWLGIDHVANDDVDPAPVAEQDAAGLVRAVLLGLLGHPPEVQLRDPQGR